MLQKTHQSWKYLQGLGLFGIIEYIVNAEIDAVLIPPSFVDTRNLIMKSFCEIKKLLFKMKTEVQQKLPFLLVGGNIWHNMDGT